MSDEANQRLKASMGGLSVITALSQRAINNAMQKLVQEHPELTDVHVKGEKSGHKLDATIGQPLVSLEVTGETRSTLEYTVCFASGTLYFAYQEPLEFPIKDWVIRFNVAIGQTKIEPYEEEYEQVRAALQQPGDYSIETLFLDLRAKDIIYLDPDRCDFNNALLPEEEIYTFGGLLALWYINKGPMQHRQNRTIGYGIHSTTPQTVNSEAPQVVPTSLRFQTYEYIAPGKDEAQEGIPEGDNNMLLYLQMTNNERFPIALDTHLKYTGNFVSRGMGGTMCIRRDILWDQYLLRSNSPLLQMLNQVTYAWVKDYNIESSYKTDVTIALSEASHGDDPSFFKWVPDDEGGNSLRWSCRPRDKREQQVHAEESWGNNRSRLNITCTTDNTMDTQPGCNNVLINGTTKIIIHVSADSGSPFDPWAYYYEVTGTVNWKTQVTVRAVSAGIEISMDLNQDSFDVKVTSKDDTDHVPNLDFDVGEKRRALEKQIKDALKDIPFQETEEKLQNDLSGAAHIVVPGQGTFAYSSPVFNNAGDLMIEIDYA